MSSIALIVGGLLIALLIGVFILRNNTGTPGLFKTLKGEAKSMAAYDAVLAHWPVAHEERDHYLTLMDMPTRFGTTHVIVSGHEGAQPIVLLHGQDSSATSWIYNVADLGQDFRVYAVDTIGDMGKSKPTIFPASREDYAEWILDVFDQLKIKKADLVGLSYGGFLAVNFSIAHPDRVDHMVLLAPGIPNFGPPTLQWANYGEPMLLLPSRLTVARFINGSSTKGYSKDDPVEEQMIVGMMNMQKVSFMRPVFTDKELNQILTPTLLLIGDHEIMYEPQKALDNAARLIPNLQEELIPNANHMLNSDQPDRIDTSIIKFFAPDPEPGN
jgi:pimeloyl-ACP methyl ester carboxylesterase